MISYTFFWGGYFFVGIVASRCVAVSFEAIYLILISTQEANNIYKVPFSLGAAKGRLWPMELPACQSVPGLQLSRVSPTTGGDCDADVFGFLPSSKWPHKLIGSLCWTLIIIFVCHKFSVWHE